MHPRCVVRVLAVLALFLSAAPARAASQKVELELQGGGEAVRGAAFVLDALAEIQAGWHINAHQPKQPYLIPTELTLTLPPGVSSEAIYYPPALSKQLGFAGGEELLLYEGKLGITTALSVSEDFADPHLRIRAALRFQACNDTTCLPPDRTEAELVVSVVAASAAPGEAVEWGLPGSAAADIGQEAQLDRWLREQGLLFTIFAVALLGLGLNLTPCVYPVVSITVAYFGGQAASRSRVVLLAVIYVLGIAASFSALGVTAALSGGLFGAALQKPAVILAIAGFLAFLALGSFGLYQIRPPAMLARLGGGASTGMVGAGFMGLTMGIVAAPCVGPIVLGLLLLVGARQDPYLGFLLFFVLALGMGAPYVFLATAAGSIRRLPRSGEWLVWTERLFGCVLLSLAAYFAAPLAPEPVRSHLLPTVVGASGLYLGFIEPAGRGVPYFPMLKRAAGVGFLAAALWLAQPVEMARAVAWEPIGALSSSASAAGENGRRPLLIDFAAEWCIPCREMDHTTYVDPDVVREAERFRMIRADISQENDATTELVERYAVRGVPTVILFSSDGQEERRMVGYVGADAMLAAMREVR